MRLWGEGRKITYIIEALIVYKYCDSTVDLSILIVQSIHHTLRILLDNFGAQSNFPVHLNRLFPHDPPSIMIVDCCSHDIVVDITKNEVTFIIYRIHLLSLIFL